MKITTDFEIIEHIPSEAAYWCRIFKQRVKIGYNEMAKLCVDNESVQEYLEKNFWKELR